MTEEQVLQCLHEITGDNDERRNVAMNILKESSKNIEFVGGIVRMSMNPSWSFANRTWCIYACLNLNMEITDEMFTLLVTGLGEADEVFRNALSKLLGLRVTSQARLNQILAIPDTLLEPKLLTLNYMIEKSEINGALSPVLMFMAQILVSNSSLQSKILAAEGLALMFCGMDTDSDLTPYRDFLLTLYSCDLTDETLPILIILYSAMSILSPQQWFDVSFRHFSILAQMAPLPMKQGKYTPLEYCCVLADGLFEVMKEYDDEVNYEIEPLVQACIMNCLVADEVVADWTCNIEHFVVDNVGGDIDDCLADDLRRTCIFIINTYNSVPFVVNCCKEMIHISPRHQEAAYYILYNVLPSGTSIDIDLGCPSEDPLTYGRYLKCVCWFQLDIDPGIIESCLRSEGHVLPILAAQALLDSDKYNGFLVAAVHRLFSFVPMFETAVLKDLFDLIQRLIQKDGSVFMPVLAEITEHISKLFIQFVSDSEVSLSLSSMIAVIAGFSGCRESVIGLFLPIAIESLRHEQTRETGFDLMIALFAQVDKIDIPSDAFEAFMFAVTNTDPNEMAFQSIFPTVAFFARNGFANVLVRWYASALANNSINGGQFKRMASVIIHLFRNCNDEEMALLVTAAVGRLQCKDPSHTIRGGLATSICAMIIIDKDRTLQILQRAGFRIEELIPTILDIFDVSCRAYLDRKVIMIAMFVLKDITAKAYDEDMTLGEVGARMVGVLMGWMNQDDQVTRFGVNEAEHQFAIDSSEAIDEDDPFLVGNPLVSVPFTVLLEQVGQGLPPEHAELIRKALTQ